MRLSEKILMLLILFHGTFIYFPSPVDQKPVPSPADEIEKAEMISFDEIPNQPVIENSTTALFAVTDKLKPQVEFWKKVFSQYSRNQILIHDNWYLDVIYDVVDISDDANRSSVSAAMKKYEGILKSLSEKWDAPETMTDEERRIYDLYDAVTESARFKKRDAYQRIRAQAGHSNYFMQGVIRSGKHMAMIKRILKEYGVPEQLACLPLVESSFSDHAESFAGAVGMWQFMGYTGKQFDLAMDDLVDERKDPEASTIAAARLLAENYRQLRFWPLAITAYNHGAGGIKKAVEQVGSYHLEDIIELYDGPRFGFASRNFYPELLAAIDVYSNHRDHFGDIDISGSVSLAKVTMQHYVSVKTLEQYCSISANDIQRFNPALNRSVFEGGGLIPKNYSLNIPAHQKTLFLASYDAIPLEKKFAYYTPSNKHKVKPGETLLTIASKYNISSDLLASVNNIKQRNKLVVGKHLEIPATLQPLTVSMAADSAPDSVNQKAKTLHSITGKTDSVFGKSFPQAADHLKSGNQRSADAFQNKSGFMSDSISTGYKPDSFFKMSSF